MLIHGNKCYDPSFVITSYMYFRKEIKKILQNYHQIIYHFQLQNFTKNI